MLTWVRTQLSRPSTSGWYYPSVPGGSETELHCVTPLSPNKGLEGKALGSRVILADEPFFLITCDSRRTININNHLCTGDAHPHPQLKMTVLVWWPSCEKALQALFMNICVFNVLLFWYNMEFKSLLYLEFSYCVYDHWFVVMESF